MADYRQARYTPDRAAVERELTTWANDNPDTSWFELDAMRRALEARFTPVHVRLREILEDANLKIEIRRPQ